MQPSVNIIYSITDSESTQGLTALGGDCDFNLAGIRLIKLFTSRHKSTSEEQKKWDRSKADLLYDWKYDGTELRFTGEKKKTDATICIRGNCYIVEDESFVKAVDCS